MIKGILTSSLKPSSIDESANNGLSLLFFSAEGLYFNISCQFCNSVCKFGTSVQNSACSKMILKT